MQRTAVPVAIGTLIYLAIAWAWRDVPLLAEDCAHFADTRQWHSAWEAFALDRMPARPVQWLIVDAMAGVGRDHPALARLPNLLCQLLALVAVGHGLRRRGATLLASTLAMSLLVAAPTTVNLVWVVAATYPLRALLATIACLAWWQHLETPHWRHGLTASLCSLVGLLGHESGVFLIAALLLAPAMVRGPRALLPAWREPWARVLAALLLARLVDLLLLRSQHQYRLQSFAAIAANTARAALNVYPAPLRETCLDGLRGHAGGVGFATALAGFALVAIGFAAWYRRGTGCERLLLVAAWMEQAPAVLAVGVGVRYLHVSVPLLALAAGWRATALRGRARAVWLAGGFALAAIWAVDTVRTIAAVRSAGQVATRLTQDLTAARAALGPQQVLVVADAPPVWGSYAEVPLFAWGLRAFLLAHGVTEPIELVRRTPIVGSTDIATIPASQWSTLFASPSHSTFAFAHDGHLQPATLPTAAPNK